jgi:hypothetical protein
MNLRRRPEETHLREVRLLKSLTPGVPFRITGSARWVPGKVSHPAIEALVRNVVVSQAQEIALKRYADDSSGTEDAINSSLGSGLITDTPYYSALTATVTLDRPTQEEIASSHEYRSSLARVERLRFLKSQLYGNPSMLLLDYIDRNPDKLDELPDLASFQLLALEVSNGEQWWLRVLYVLEKLSSEVSDEKGNLWAMNVLLTALKESAPDLFSHREKEAQLMTEVDNGA